MPRTRPPKARSSKRKARTKPRETRCSPPSTPTAPPGSSIPCPSRPLTALAAAQVGVGKPALAIPLAEQALTILGKHHPDPGQLAAAQFALARALVAAYGDATRANAPAKSARDELLQAPWTGWQMEQV